MAEIIVCEDEVGKRLDSLLADRFQEFSRTYFQRIIGEGLVLVNGEPVKKRYLPQIGDEIEIEFQLSPEISLKAENIPLDILYEDPYLLAINKPAGLVVHPAPGNISGTFANALLFYIADIMTSTGHTGLRPGIVHRLDKDTTGVLIAAKQERAQRLLVDLFATRAIEKEYLAITVGHPGEKTFTGSIGRHTKNRKAMAIREEGGRSAETRVETIAYDGTLSYVRLFPKTGRTHQIRVHLQANDTPILGDPLYGNTGMNHKFRVSRPLLHARRITFIHPILNESLEIVAPIPKDMELWIKKISAT